MSESTSAHTTLRTTLNLVEYFLFTCCLRLPRCSNTHTLADHADDSYI